MSLGAGRALRQSARLLAAHPVAWVPSVAVGAPLLLLWLVWLQVTFAAGSAGLTTGELQRLRWILLLVGAALLTVQAAYAAGGLYVFDRLLREERATWGDWLDGVVALGWRLGARRLSLFAARAVVAVVTVLLFWRLLTGGDTAAAFARALETGLSVTLAAWSQRGIGWVLGMLVLIAGSLAVGNLLRQVAVFGRAVTVTHGDGGLRDLERAARLAGRSSRLLFGRASAHGAVWLAALLLPRLLIAPAAMLAAGADGSAAVFLGQLVRAAGLIGLAVTLALAASYLTLGDLILYRAHGGADGDRELYTRGARERGLPRGRIRSVTGRPASEPAGDLWRPRPASEPSSADWEPSL